MSSIIKFDKFEEQVFLNTVLIKNLTDGEFGTGFLIKKLNAAGTGGKFLLFSNKHVFWGKNDWKDKRCGEKNLNITLHKNQADGSYKPGTVHQFNLKIQHEDVGYYEHPDEEIDVACINISEAFNNPDVVPNVKAISENLLDLNLGELYSGSEVVFIGYPTGFYDRVNSLPVLRSGIIASIPALDFNGKSQILLDAQIFPGSSGSPVFAKTGSGYKLLGIISEAAFFEQQFIKVDSMGQKNKNEYPIQFIGLGMAYKLSTLRMVYDLVSPENGKR